MIGQTSFTYTDKDMVAAQRAGWMWFARWRNWAIAYIGLVVFNIATLAGLNAWFGTRPVPSDPYAVIIGSAGETGLVFGLLFWVAQTQGRAVLRSRKPGLPWNGDELGGEQAWAWDGDGLHIRHDRGRADLAWTAVGAWLESPAVLLLFPAGGRAFSLPEPVRAAGWRDAPKIFIYPGSGFALALPKRALAADDATRLVEMLRSAGVPERPRFGWLAAGHAGAHST